MIAAGSPEIAKESLASVMKECTPSTTARAVLPHRAGAIRLSAAVVMVAAAVLPAAAQNPPSGGGSAVGLPPASVLRGTPRRLPDGSIAIAPENVQPRPGATAPPPRRRETRLVPNAHVEPTAEVAKPPLLRVAQTVSSTASSGLRSPPGATIVSQIHNAPGWQHSHAYSYAAGPYTRVVSGPGWDEANGTYMPGRALAAYQLTSTGSCTSAAGGGPAGTGAAIADGTCTWKYLSGVDYISITGWAFDNQPWKTGTLYHYLDFATADSPLRAYALQNDGCTSTVAPTGTGNKIDTGDGCHWQYQADIIYTSRKSYIPTETFTDSRSAATLHMKANYEAHLWNDREYVAGQNGEAAPIRAQDHDDYRHEGGVILGCTTTPCYHLIITTAPGESFHDRLTPADPLTGYDPSKGAGLRNSLPYKWPYEPAGFDVHDNHTDFIGLQIKSIHGAAVNGMSSFGNAMLIRDCILDGGSDDQWTSHAAVTVDTSSVVANSLVISHAPIGVVFKYPGFLLHSTVVNPDRIANSVGIETFFKWVYDDTTVSNAAIFGFAHAVAHDEAKTSWSPRSSNNITDAPPNDSGTGHSPYSNSAAPAATVDLLPGTTYGASMAAAFAATGRDWRLSAASPLRGAGSAFGVVAVGCQQLSRDASCPQLMNYGFDTPDIIGTARPQAGHYDIGAWQSLR